MKDKNQAVIRRKELISYVTQKCNGLISKKEITNILDKLPPNPSVKVTQNMFQAGKYLKKLGKELHVYLGNIKLSPCVDFDTSKKFIVADEQFMLIYLPQKEAVYASYKEAQENLLYKKCNGVLTTTEIQKVVEKVPSCSDLEILVTSDIRTTGDSLYWDLENKKNFETVQITGNFTFETSKITGETVAEFDVQKRLVTLLPKKGRKILLLIFLPECQNHTTYKEIVENEFKNNRQIYFSKATKGIVSSADLVIKALDKLESTTYAFSELEVRIISNIEEVAEVLTLVDHSWDHSSGIGGKKEQKGEVILGDNLSFGEDYRYQYFDNGNPTDDREYHQEPNFETSDAFVVLIEEYTSNYEERYWGYKLIVYIPNSK